MPCAEKVEGPNVAANDGLPLSDKFWKVKIIEDFIFPNDL